MTWRTVPFKPHRTTPVMEHETIEEAKERAQKIANKTGDWCVVEDPSTHDKVYIQPAAPRRR